MIKRPSSAGQPFEIHYAKGQDRFLPHLIAHEVGHIVRLYYVPEEERSYAVGTAENRRRAVGQIAAEIVPLIRAGIPEEVLPEIFDTLYRGVVTQLTSFPADLRIEQWIHDRFAGLRQIQRRSLLVEVHRSIPLFRPEVVALTPPTIYRATMAMNAAQAYHVAELYSLPDLTLPFNVNGLGPIGARLARMVFDAADEGHRSDMAATDAWAQDVNLAGWMQWQSASSERCLGLELETS